MARTLELPELNWYTAWGLGIGFTSLKAKGTRFPGGKDVLIAKEHENGIITKDMWDAYPWTRDSGYLGGNLNLLSKPDPDASPKPPWDELLLASRHGVIDFVVAKTLNEVRTHCERRIAEKIYGARNRNHEAQIRNRLARSLRAADKASLQTMEYWRSHYRFRYHEIKEWVLRFTDGVIDSEKAIILILLNRGYIPSAFFGVYKDTIDDITEAPASQAQGATGVDGEEADGEEVNAFGIPVGTEVGFSDPSEAADPDRRAIFEDDSIWDGPTWSPPTSIFNPEEAYDEHDEMPVYETRGPINPPPFDFEVIDDPDIIVEYDAPVSDGPSGAVDLATVKPTAKLEIPLFASAYAIYQLTLPTGLTFRELRDKDGNRIDSEVPAEEGASGQVGPRAARRAGKFKMIVQADDSVFDASTKAVGAPYGEDKEVNVQTTLVPMELGEPEARFVTAEASFRDLAVELPSGIIEGGGAGFLRKVRLTKTGTVQISLADTAAGNPAAAGPSLKTGIESAHQLVLYSPGQKLVVPWANDPSNTQSRPGEPYEYRVSAEKTAEISTFVDALAASGNKNCMLTIHKVAVTAGRRA